MNRCHKATRVVRKSYCELISSFVIVVCDNIERDRFRALFPQADKKNSLTATDQQSYRVVSILPLPVITMSTSHYSSRPLHHGNMTRAMAKSMKGMGDALACFLCSKVIDQPRTLSACGHSFCFACIEDYAKDNWHCPGMSYTHAMINVHR